MMKSPNISKKSKEKNCGRKTCLYMLISFLVGISFSFIYIDKTSILFSIKKDSQICSSNLLNVTIKKILFNEKDSCGFWKENFVKIHQSILNDKSSSNYLISYSFKGNFSLNLNKIIFDFYLSLLSKRAFQLMIDGTINQFESVYSYSTINWTISSTNRLFIQDNSHFNIFDENITLNQYSSKQILLSKSNQSQIKDLFSNEIYENQFNEFGLTIDNCFHCAFQYLFQLKNIFRLRNSLLKFNESLIISIDIQLIHINQTILLENYQNYIECAQQIESFRKNQNKQIFWYLTSNSLKLKRILKQKYPKKLLTNDQSDHFDHFHKEYPFEIVSVEFDEIRSSQFHILSPLSHLARLAILTTDHFKQVYRIDQQQTTCSIANPVSFTDLMHF